MVEPPEGGEETPCLRPELHAGRSAMYSALRLLFERGDSGAVEVLKLFGLGDEHLRQLDEARAAASTCHELMGELMLLYMNELLERLGYDGAASTPLARLLDFMSQSAASMAEALGSGDEASALDQLFKQSRLLGTYLHPLLVACAERAGGKEMLSFARRLIEEDRALVLECVQRALGSGKGRSAGG